MTDTPSAPRAATHRTPHSGVMNNFWIGRVLIARVIPIMALVLLTYNPFGFSVWSLGVWLAAYGGVSSPVHLILLTLVVIAAGALWVYVLRKAWHGAGAGFIKFMVVPVIFALLLALLVVTNTVDQSGLVFTVLVELALGAALGLMFSFTIVDRKMSGTASTTIIEEDNTQDDSHHVN